MANLISNGGCYNASRWANDGAGQGTRDWIAADDVNIIDHNLDLPLILSFSFDSDDMNTIAADFEVRWRNVTDGGSMAVLTGAGVIKWATGTDLINGNAVVTGERGGSSNCSGKNPTHRNGIEREGANAINDPSINTQCVFDHQWAIDFSGCVGGKEYEFDVVETGTSNVYGVSSSVSILVPGKITGTTKDANRGSAVGGVTVTAYLSDEAGSDPVPTTAGYKSQTVSDISTGVYTLTGLGSGQDYFLHFYKDDTEDLSDGSGPVTAVDV